MSLTANFFIRFLKLFLECTGFCLKNTPDIFIQKIQLQIAYEKVSKPCVSSGQPWTAQPRACDPIIMSAQDVHCGDLGIP